ncbi:UNVERIFIED_CONTAM: hypothetical protein Slati_4140200 [Sesamum latifolium]|uniref:ADP,ATP carrier protein n=1 Tax=Sesamum latifolium TaxID=2727402 RepID=A0AAW2TAG5_9LAMI
MIIDKSRIESIISIFVTVYPHETSALIYSTSSFFFILSAYFVVLPLRDEGAISLGLGKLPGLFVGSLLLTLVAAPVSTLIFSLPNLSKGKALVLIHRFFSLSLVIFFVLWLFSTPGSSPVNIKEMLPVNSTIKEELKVAVNQTIPANYDVWENHGWFYIVVRIAMFLWIALLNLITISSTWARVIDVMDSESGSRLFGFVGAGATLGQLFGSLFATGMAWLGPYLLLFAALLLEFAAQSSKGIKRTFPSIQKNLLPSENCFSSFVSLFNLVLLVFPRFLLSVKADTGDINKTNEQSELAQRAASPRTSLSMEKPQMWPILEGLQLILSSAYLLQVALFLWLSAVVSSFFYFQVVMYVVARPGRELLFTVVTKDEKYKAKVCLDVIVQRLGDATAAGMYKLLFSTLNGNVSNVPLYALPVCFLWIVTAFNLGRRQTQLAKFRTSQRQDTQSR